MKILVLNGSPHENGTTAKALQTLLYNYRNDENQIVYHNVHDLTFDFCKGCKACRKNGKCLLPQDAAHKIAEEINWCEMLIIGSPV